jgi:thymidylate synthase (FAD)
MVVNAARVSFDKRHEAMDESDEGLINYLMKHRHGTPFEHNFFCFHVKLPIFVAREWMRHRIGSFNEMSGRYVELEPEFYVPAGDAIRMQMGKPGNYHFETLIDQKASVREGMEVTYNLAYRAYQQLLKMGLAKEVARDVLPVGIYTQFYWSINARSLMNFLNLRNHERALYEIREYAKHLEEIFMDKMPTTCRAFVKNGRVAP